MPFQSRKETFDILLDRYVSSRNKTAEEMTNDIVNHQIVELKKLIDEKKLQVNDIDVFCEKGDDRSFSRREDDQCLCSIVE